tara:strand:+ start:2346 stop:3443 length:1098 start_codon:yes stop_codon:yes gene_type:complete
MLKWTLVFLLLANQAMAAIGEITEIQGSGIIKRESDTIDGAKGAGLESMDTISTENGSMMLEFIDDTRVDVTEHSRLVIDEFIYDPNTNTGSLSLTAGLGAVRYASGQIAKNNRQNVKIATPTASISVRGTDFMMIVDEIGGSMITLLPSCNTAGLCVVGEISVETDAGQVIMNQAFQTTVVTSSSSLPRTPVIIDLPENQLRAMLIVRKESPYKVAADDAQPAIDVLGFDFLEYNNLGSNELDESIKGIWATDLDNTSYLKNALVDMLDLALAEMITAFGDELGSQNAEFFAQKTFGLDSTTNIFYDENGSQYTISRSEGSDHTFSLKLSQQTGYTINITQGDFSNYGYKAGVGDSTINIIQSN